MNTEQFELFWNSRYPESLPISHYLRHGYLSRWFRIHSLPESKRYANNETEWAILLNRQNTVISNLLGNNTNIVLVTGEYRWDNTLQSEPDLTLESISELPSLASLDFTPASLIDLHQINPEDYDLGNLYQPMFSEQIWQNSKFDNLLKDIADDRIRVIFVALDTEYLIAPYDGGIDFILPDTETRNTYRDKYKEWLSQREDGL
jgi:hypothetical protein